MAMPIDFLKSNLAANSFRCVEIRVSKIKGSGEGTFAKRAMKAGTHVSFYNGVRMSADDLDEDSKEDWEANAYKIMDLLGPHPVSSMFHFKRLSLNA